MKRRIGIALGGVVVLAVGVAAAPGAAGTEGGKTLVTTTGDPDSGLSIAVKAAPGATNRIVLLGPQGQPSDLLYARIRDTKAGITEDSPDCNQTSPTEVRCRAESLRGLDVHTGDGPDRLLSLMSASEMDTWKAARSAPGSKVRVFMGPGNDGLHSSAEVDTWKAERGGSTSAYQVIAMGQAGNDTLLGGTEDQRLSGGNGSDVLSGGPGEGDYCDGAADDDQGGEGCEEIVSIP